VSSTPQEAKQPAPDEDEISVLDLLIVLVKHKKLIAGTTFGAAVFSTIVALLLPNIYTGTAKVLPPQQNQSTAAMMLGQLTGLASLAGSTLGIKNPNDLFVGMLKSRTVADNIIARFDLHAHYRMDTLVETRRELADNTQISAGRDGLITIEFQDVAADRAAAIANAYVEELDRLTQTIAVTEAAQRRLFFERQLHQAKNDLGSAEVALKETQEKTGLIKLDDQGRAIIEAVATLRAQVAAKEVELRAMRTFTTEQNPDYRRAQQQLAGLRAELTKLERSSSSDTGNLFLPTGMVPEAGLEYLRKFRDVKYQETIFELVAKQFEAAKIDEAKEATIVQVVDRAVPPDRRSSPNRILIVAVSVFVAAFAAVASAVLIEAWRQLGESDIGRAKRARLRALVQPKA
jgi:tyrosine-protein kinase Etk/Wzc